MQRNTFHGDLAYNAGSLGKWFRRFEGKFRVQTFGEEGNTLLRNVENKEATKHHAPEDDIPPLHHCGGGGGTRSNFVSSCGRLCDTEGLQYPIM
jgi:hypothetical protein